MVRRQKFNYPQRRGPQCIFDYFSGSQWKLGGWEAHPPQIEHWLPLKEVPDSSISSLIPVGWLAWGRASRHQKTRSNIPRGRQLPLIWWLNRISSKWKRSLWLNGRSQNVANDWLLVAVGKQPSMPLKYLGRKWTLSWWWECQKLSYVNFRCEFSNWFKIIFPCVWMLMNKKANMDYGRTVIRHNSFQEASRTTTHP